MMHEVICHGDTDAERKSFAMGYRLGMFAASKLLQDRAKEAGEVAGACPAGPYTESANVIQARLPKGEIISTHWLK